MSRRLISDRRRRAREGGYAAILVAMLAAAVFIPVTALAVDVARWYVELERVQTAADAAATAGVTYMPDDFANARTTAIAVSGRNGYPNSGTSTVTVEATSKPSQLKVTVTSTIPNAFGTAFGEDFTTVSRSAVADFNGPAPMGSPCNSYGNEPTGAMNLGTAASTGNVNNRGPSTASVIVAPAGGASCTSNPQFWGGHRRTEHAQGQRRRVHDPDLQQRQQRLHRDHQQRVQPARLLLHRPGCAERRRAAHDDPDLRPGVRPGRGRVRATDRAGSAISNNWSPFVPLDAQTRYAGGSRQLVLQR